MQVAAAIVAGKIFAPIITASRLHTSLINLASGTPTNLENITLTQNGLSNPITTV